MALNTTLDAQAFSKSVYDSLGYSGLVMVLMANPPHLPIPLWLVKIRRDLLSS